MDTKLCRFIVRFSSIAFILAYVIRNSSFRVVRKAQYFEKQAYRANDKMFYLYRWLGNGRYTYSPVSPICRRGAHIPFCKNNHFLNYLCSWDTKLYRQIHVSSTNIFEKDLKTSTVSCVNVWVGCILCDSDCGFAEGGVEGWCILQTSAYYTHVTLNTYYPTHN